MRWRFHESVNLRRTKTDGQLDSTRKCAHLIYVSNSMKFGGDATMDTKETAVEEGGDRKSIEGITTLVINSGRIFPYT